MNMKTSALRQGRAARKKRKIILYLVMALFVLCVVCFASFLAVKAMGRTSLEKKAKEQTPGLVSDIPGDTETGAGEEGVVYRNGQKYRYNEKIHTILCLGIDKKSGEFQEERMGDGGQSDAIFLLVLDEENRRMSVIAIPRDTMTEVDHCDAFGQYYETATEQLTLQYAYGDGEELSCELTTKAVSNLLYNLPVSAYVSIHMSAIPILNDAVGGVTLTVPETIGSFQKGEEVTLTGEQARMFVQGRDMQADYSSIGRLQRQKAYLLAFIGQAVSAVKENLSLTLTLYDSIEEYMITDISASEAAYLAMTAAECSFDADSFYIVPGEQQKGEVYEEYHVDDEALYELLLDVFYLPENE